MSEGPQDLADGPCRSVQALPHAALLDRHAREKEARVAKLGEIGLDQCNTPLALMALRGKTGRHFANVLEDCLDIHSSCLPSS
jgi:hypothetical protein